MKQHSVTLCNTLQHSATLCNTLWHNATHCNTRQHTTTYSLTIQRASSCETVRHHLYISVYTFMKVLHGNTLQHTATQSNTPQHTVTHSRTIHRSWRCKVARHHLYICIYMYVYMYESTHCNTLQHTHSPFTEVARQYLYICIYMCIYMYEATHCNTLQHTTTHYNTLHHTTTLSNTRTHHSKNPKVWNCSQSSASRSCTGRRRGGKGCLFERKCNVEGWSFMDFPVNWHISKINLKQEKALGMFLAFHRFDTTTKKILMKFWRILGSFLVQIGPEVGFASGAIRHIMFRCNQTWEV